MSAGTFTDEKGQVWVVGPDGVMTKAGASKQAIKPPVNAATKVTSALPGALTAGLVASQFGGSAAPAAATGISNAVTTASQAGSAWAGNLGEFAGGAEPGMFDIEGIGGAGNVILPAVGLAGAYDLYANRPESVGTGRGYLQGGLSGAAMGSYFGPVGAGVGAGLGLLANAFGIGGKSRTKIEEDRRKQLAEQGVVIPNSDIKEWENNAAFRASRNEADLTGKDIINSASLYGLSGYAAADAAKKEAIANEALKQGLVREHHGTIDIGMNEAYQKFVESQLNAPTPTTSTSNRVQRDPRIEKERKRQQIAQIIPEVESTPTRGPRYDINLSSLMTNPYL